MASAKYRSEVSAAGESLSVLKSAIQKYIRRGELEKADYCMGQLLSFASAPEDNMPAVICNVAHRLMVIAIEDAGLCPSAMHETDVGATMLLQWRKNRGDLRPVAAALSRSVAALVAATKSRSASHARNFALMFYEAGPVVDYVRENWPPIYAVYEKYHLSGASMPAVHEILGSGGPESFLRLYAYWEANTSIVKRRELVSVLAQQWPTEKALLLRWLDELQGLKDACLCAWVPLVWAAYGRDPQTQVRELPGDPLVRWQSASRMPLDSYVYDKHVAGAPAGVDKSMTNFVTVGAHVENESPRVDKFLRDFYVAVRVWRDENASAFGVAQKRRGKAAAQAAQTSIPAGAPNTLPAAAATRASPAAAHSASAQNGVLLETNEFRLVVRAQLVCSQYRQDVYAAEHRDLGAVFVKGPYRDPNVVQSAIIAEDWKRSNGIPATRSMLLWMIPDRWPEGTAAGLRNHIDRNVPAPFLVTQSLLEVWPPKTRIHSSTTWPPTEILDSDRSWDPVAMWNTASEQEKADYVMGICARIVLGVGDMADRNFCRSNGRVYSIDEDSATHEEPKMDSELRGREKRALISEWIASNHGQLMRVISTWNAPVFEGSAERLQKVKILPPSGFW